MQREESTSYYGRYIRNAVNHNNNNNYDMNSENLNSNPNQPRGHSNNNNNRFAKSHKLHPGPSPSSHEMQRLMTDRAAYLSYLEVQLERVSAACLVSQGFSERIEGQQTQICSLEEKLVNLAKMLRLSKAFTSEENRGAERGVQQLADRLRHVESDIAKFVLSSSTGAGSVGEGNRALVLGASVEKVAGLMAGQSPLQVLREAAGQAAREALEALPVLEEIRQLSRKYSDHSLHLATIKTEEVKLRDGVGEIEGRVTQLASLVSSHALQAQEAESARGDRLEER